MNDNEASVFPGISREGREVDNIGVSQAWFGGCGCWTCTSERVSELPSPYNLSMPFIVCPDCGNKRCPKATHHDNKCTGSNDPEQPGSRYGGLPVDPEEQAAGQALLDEMIKRNEEKE